jgi:hypothetical protein
LKLPLKSLLAPHLLLLYFYCCTVHLLQPLASLQCWLASLLLLAYPYRQLLVSLLQLTTPLLLASLALLVSFLFLVICCCR